jgi:hypothetical protein
MLTLGFVVEMGSGALKFTEQSRSITPVSHSGTGYTHLTTLNQF